MSLGKLLLLCLYKFNEHQNTKMTKSIFLPVQSHVKVDRHRFRDGDALDFFGRALAEDGEVRLAHAPHHDGHALALRRELELADDANLFLERHLTNKKAIVP